MHEFPLIATVAAGFAAAWVLGLFTQWLRLSPIVGYLLAGVVIGPHTPGFVGDLNLAHQLAEVGVILLMFGVGLHFHLDDLIAVKGVAIPGALGQSLAATIVSVAVFMLFDIEPRTGAVIGMALAVASTVVLMRVLMDADALHSPAGHVAVGWLLVEDVLTVVALVMIPVLGSAETTPAEAGPWSSPVAAIAFALLKLVALVGIVMVIGSRVIPWVLIKVARLRSRELFTLTVMVFSVAIAAGAYVVFGASMALGAFLAGMVVAQSPVSHQAAADALPFRDAFSVLFFVSVGMLFDPMFLLREPLLMLVGMGIILLVKPLVALFIVSVLGHSVRTALTVALGLAQIGEFSFILSDVARKHGLMPDSGHNLLVGGAILSITLNPILFRSIDGIERWLRRHPRLWSLLNSRFERKVKSGGFAQEIRPDRTEGNGLAVVVGFGPVGQTVDRLLRQAGLATVVIDMNMDTVAELRLRGQSAVFGDASREAILESSGVDRASHLVLTLPQSTNRLAIVAMARSLNPKLKIFVRARYLREREDLEQVGITGAIFEEAEAAVALARLVLIDTGAGKDSIEHAVRDIRMRLILENVSNLHNQTIRNIMVPWTRVRRLSNAFSLHDVRRQLRQYPFSRWPVVDAETGQPLGYLLAKDLISVDSDHSSWTELVRPLSTIGPEDNIEATLIQFQGDGATICLVQDRGSTLGIVTIEDLLEQVIGRIGDEYRHAPRIALSEMLLIDDSLLNLISQVSEQAIAEMARKIPADLMPPRTDVAELAIARERQISTHVGHGVAIPHARCPHLANPIVAIGRSADGILFDTQSADRVYLLFLLVTPTEQPDIQVQLLSQIARLAGDPEILQALREASSAFDIAEVLRQAEQDLLPSPHG